MRGVPGATFVVVQCLEGSLLASQEAFSIQLSPDTARLIQEGNYVDSAKS
jgi:hypothetical protein